MKTQEFYMDIPEQLIAHYPLKDKLMARLMLIDPQKSQADALADYHMKDFPDLLDENTHIVFNDTKVRLSRFFAYDKQGNSRIEIVLLKCLNRQFNEWEVISGGKLKEQEYFLPENISISIKRGQDRVNIMSTKKPLNEQYIEKWGSVPLPPYIKRAAEDSDKQDYQSIFADKIGSAAAPTASLHFSQDLLQQLKDKGVEMSYVTLHVGLGTFAPIKTENIQDFKIHEEEFELTEETAQQLQEAKLKGKKILAVGTTVFRTLESAYQVETGTFKTGKQQTNLFVYPGYSIKIVDQLFTNFHQPDSSLITLVSAFAGVNLIKKAYQRACEKNYRFFSYGDACFFKNHI